MSRPATGPSPDLASPPKGPVKRWVLGARPRTLPAAVVPVLVGTAAAHSLDGFRTPVGWTGYAPLSGGGSGHAVQIGSVGLPGVGGVNPWWCALGALIVGLAIQVGTNYANDYSDGVRGTDDARVGPVRLVAGGLASPGAVRRAALIAFGVAGLAGLGLAWATSWWVLVVGAACLLAGWFYTGGPRPYGYAGLGEVFVFVFFGLVATVGTFYVQTLSLRPAVVWFAAVLVGLLATALLLANNLRDIDTDRTTGKHTLAVRLGRRRAGYAYAGGVALPFAGVLAWAVLSATGTVTSNVGPIAFVPLVAFPLAVPMVRMATGPAEGRALLPVLAGTARLQMVFGALLALALWLWIL